jgi:hypothetical protein
MTLKFTGWSRKNRSHGSKTDDRHRPALHQNELMDLSRQRIAAYARCPTATNKILRDACLTECLRRGMAGIYFAAFELARVDLRKEGGALQPLGENPGVEERGA